jgi:hypothetical protein
MVIMTQAEMTAAGRAVDQSHGRLPDPVREGSSCGSSLPSGLPRPSPMSNEVDVLLWVSAPLPRLPPWRSSFFFALLISDDKEEEKSGPSLDPSTSAAPNVQLISPEPSERNRK